MQLKKCHDLAWYHLTKNQTFLIAVYVWCNRTEWTQENLKRQQNDAFIWWWWCDFVFQSWCAFKWKKGKKKRRNWKLLKVTCLCLDNREERKVPLVLTSRTIATFYGHSQAKVLVISLITRIFLTIIAMWTQNPCKTF